MIKDYINYPKIIDDAMHQAVCSILKTIQLDGIQGKHHFFISFITTFPGVTLSNRVKVKYPEEITIVIQHQFDELIVEKEYFTLRLSFNGISEKISVPYKAITSFVDAGTKFAVEFRYYSMYEDEISQKANDYDDKPELDRENIIILDKFRNNKK